MKPPTTLKVTTNYDRWMNEAQENGLKPANLSCNKWAWLLGHPRQSTDRIRIGFHVDHLRAVTDKTGRRIVVCMPYYFGTSDIKGLATFCETHDLDVEITSWLPWVQEKTITILIKESMANFQKRNRKKSA